MKAYVIGSSALYFWRRSLQFLSVPRALVAAPYDDCPTTREELEGLQLDTLGFGNAPIRLMVPSTRFRILKNTYKYSVQSQALPANAFRRLNANVCIASPELCLFESRNAYSRFRLIELAMELCGKYALVPEEPRGFLSRNHQLATVDSIRTFAKSVSHINGSKQLLDICRFIKDGSRSPMETREYLLSCLPKRFGGYGLPSPVLNARIGLNADEQRIVRRKYLECDNYWEEQRVVIEYDGHDDHESRESRARDALKRNLLTSRGYRVFTITGKQIMDASSFDAAMRDVAVSLGYRLKGFPRDWDIRRDRLREELFASLTNYEFRRFHETQRIKTTGH